MSATTAIRDRRILEMQRGHAGRLRRAGAASIALAPSTAAGWWSFALHSSDEFLEDKAAKLPASEPRDWTGPWVQTPDLDDRTRNLAFVIEGLDPRAAYLDWRTDHRFLDHLCNELFTGADKRRLNDIQRVLGALTHSPSHRRLRSVLGDRLIEELRGRSTRQEDLGPRNGWIQIAERLSTPEGAPTRDQTISFTPRFLRLWLEELQPEPDPSFNEALQILSMVARGLLEGTMRLSEHRPLLDAAVERIFDAPIPHDLAVRIQTVLSRYLVGGSTLTEVWNSVLEAFRRRCLLPQDRPLSQNEILFGSSRVTERSPLRLRDELSERAIASLDGEAPLHPMLVLNLVRSLAPSAEWLDALRTRLEARRGNAGLDHGERIDALGALITGWPALHGTRENEIRVARYRLANPTHTTDGPSNAMTLVRLGEVSREILGELLNFSSWNADQQAVLDSIGVEQLATLGAVELAAASERPAQAALALDLAGLNDPRLLDLVLTSTGRWGHLTQLLPFLEKWSVTDDTVHARTVAAVRAAGSYAPDDVRRAFLAEVRQDERDEAQALIDLIAERHLEGRSDFPCELARYGPFAGGQRRETLLDDVIRLLGIRPDIAQTVRTLALSPSERWKTRHIYPEDDQTRRTGSHSGPPV